jgi:hypothetical protein
MISGTFVSACLVCSEAENGKRQTQGVTEHCFGVLNVAEAGFWKLCSYPSFHRSVHTLSFDLSFVSGERDLESHRIWLFWCGFGVQAQYLGVTMKILILTLA